MNSVMKKFIKVFTCICTCMCLIPTISAKDIYEESIDLNSSNAVVEEIAFDDMVKEISETTGESEKEIIDHFISNRFELMEEQGQVLKNSTRDSILNMIRATNYITVKVYDFPILNGTYRPNYISFYGQGDKPSFDKARMYVIEKVTLDRSNGLTGSGLPASKQFGGDIFVKLERNDKIHFIVEGDFYNNGTTTYSSGINVSISESVTVNVGISYATSHFAYMNHTGDWLGTW